MWNIRLHREVKSWLVDLNFKNPKSAENSLMRLTCSPRMAQAWGGPLRIASEEAPITT
jgi:hypothetical protein